MDSEPPVSVSPLWIQRFANSSLKSDSIGSDVAGVIPSILWKGSGTEGRFVVDGFLEDLPQGLGPKDEEREGLKSITKSWLEGGKDSSIFQSKLWPEICHSAPLLGVALCCCTQKLHDFVGEQFQKSLDGKERCVTITSRSIQVDGEGKGLIHSSAEIILTTKKLGSIIVEFRLGIAFLPTLECERADLDIVLFQGESTGKKDEALRQHLLLCGFSTSLLKRGNNSAIDSDSDESDDDLYDDDDDDDLYDDDDDNDDDEEDLFCLKDDSDLPAQPPSPKTPEPSREEEPVSESPPREEPRSESPPREELRSESPPREEPRSESPPREEHHSESPSREQPLSESPQTSPQKEECATKSPSPVSSSPKSSVQSPSSDQASVSPSWGPSSPSPSSQTTQSQEESSQSSTKQSAPQLSPSSSRSLMTRSSLSSSATSLSPKSKERRSPQFLSGNRDNSSGSLTKTSGSGFAQSMTNFPTQEGAPGTDKSSEKRDKGTWKFSLNTKKRRAMLDNIGRREGEEGGDDEKGGEREGEKEEQIRKKSVKEDWKDNSGERRSRGCTRQRSEQLPDPVAVPAVVVPKYNDFELINGEVVVDEKLRVLYLGGQDSETWLLGTMLVTNCRILWISNDWAKQPKAFYSNFVCGDLVVHIPYSMIYKMDTKKKKKREAFSLSTYIFGLHQFQFQSVAIKNEVASKIRETVPTSISNFFAFSHRPNNSIPSMNGWNLFNEEKEYSRFFISSTKWRMTRANVGYALCDTYPEILCVPEAITDDELVQIAQFRSRGRFPVMTWRHPVNTATLSRCAQPRVGLKGKRCDEDERLLSAMLETNESNNSQIWLMDARPRVNAMANAAMGAGVEDAKIYDMVKIKFLGIENIHAMRKSFSSLFDLCCHSSGKSLTFYSALESTKWMEYVRLILRSAVRIVRIIHVQSANVIIHCSDGWDRTPQLSSLSIIMMDPYPRTMVGFFRLIEMEWASFGHKFCDRMGHMVGMKESEMSPVFLQFIDCVYQIMAQFPTEFEFNQTMLMCLLYHSSSSQFGTFLFNTPKTRKDAKVKANTTSLWSYILSEKDTFTNPLYKYSNGVKEKDSVLVPHVGLQDLTFWKEFYVGGASRAAYFQTWAFLKERVDAGVSPLSGTISGAKIGGPVQKLISDEEKAGNRRSLSNPTAGLQLSPTKGSRSPKSRGRVGAELASGLSSPRKERAPSKI